MNFREEAYLMHYGVPGMKWGQRRKVYSAAIKKATKDMVDKRTAFQEETKKRMTNTPRGKDRIAVRNAREFEYRSTIVKKYDSDVAKARSNMHESKLAYKKQKYDANMAKKAERKAKWLLAEQHPEKASNLRKSPEIKRQIKIGQQKVKEFNEKYGDKYEAYVDDKGIVTYKIGDDIWRIGY